MSELIECPYCSAKVYRQGGFNYNETITIPCPYCGRSFELVPGFGTLTTKKPPSDTQAIYSDRPQTASRPYKDPIFAEGRAAPDPWHPRKVSSKPFDPVSECARACLITAGLFVIMILLYLSLFGILLSPFIFP